MQNRVVIFSIKKGKNARSCCIARRRDLYLYSRALGRLGNRPDHLSNSLLETSKCNIKIIKGYVELFLLYFLHLLGEYNIL